MKGVRGTVFKCAEKYHGRLNNSIQETIYYPPGSEDLFVRLLFEEKRDALDFLVELSRLASEHHRFQDIVEFERELEIVTMFTQATLIFFKDYVTGDSLSPECLTLTDILTEYSRLTTISYNPNDPSIALKSFEDINILPPLSKLYRCHIASKIKYPQYKSDDDNTILASGDFHNYFDGMMMDTGDPEMALRYDGDDGEMSVVVDAMGTRENRVKIFIFFEFRNESVASFMKHRIRDYEEHSPLGLRSFLFVKDKDRARMFFDIKYKETQSLWAVRGVDSDV